MDPMRLENSLVYKRTLWVHLQRQLIAYHPVILTHGSSALGTGFCRVDVDQLTPIFGPFDHCSCIQLSKDYEKTSSTHVNTATASPPSPVWLSQSQCTAMELTIDSPTSCICISGLGYCASSEVLISPGRHRSDNEDRPRRCTGSLASTSARRVFCLTLSSFLALRLINAQRPFSVPPAHIQPYPVPSEHGFQGSVVSSSRFRVARCKA